ncbi:hypothetical protein BC936DRAFT_140609, partial [Jimgerdemannia flammicorona]
TEAGVESRAQRTGRYGTEQASSLDAPSPFVIHTHLPSFVAHGSSYQRSNTDENIRSSRSVSGRLKRLTDRITIPIQENDNLTVKLHRARKNIQRLRIERK